MTNKFLSTNENIAFIICSNNDGYLSECKYYINNLYVPDNISVEIIVINDAKSMTEGYNRACNMTNAKYKVYLHQDVFILNRYFISNIIDLFKEDPFLGILGVAGTKKIPRNASVWQTLDIGACYSIGTFRDYGYIAVKPQYTNPEGILEEVEYVDGMLIATSHDIEWDERISGFHFYDLSQCIRYRQNGYKIAVVRQDNLWTYHDFGPLNLETYEKYRKRFCETYGGFDFSDGITTDSSNIYRMCAQIASVAKEYICSKDFNKLKKLFKDIDNAVYFDNDLITMLFLSEINEFESIAGTNILFTPDCASTYANLESKFQYLKWQLIRLEFGLIDLQVITDAIVASEYSIWAVIIIFLHCVTEESQNMLALIGKNLASINYISASDWSFCVNAVREYEKIALPSASNL